MKTSDIQYLECVDCQGDLSIKESPTQGDLIINALLVCMSCKRYFPVLRGVGIFFRKNAINQFLHTFEISLLKEFQWDDLVISQESKSDPLVELQWHGARNYEYQWDNMARWEEDFFVCKDYGSLENFQDFIPIDFEAFKDKKILVGCGGRGREAYHLLKFDPIKIIVVEIGKSIYEIAKNISDPESKLILLRSDLTYSPLKKNIADFSICDHALQHIVDHISAFKRLVETTKSGGVVSVCVYSYEGNFLMTQLVEPAKRFFPKRSLKIMQLASFVPTLVVYLAIKIIYVPISRLSESLVQKLPMGKHMLFWSNLSFNSVWTACNDLMNAPVTFHFTKGQMISLCEKNKMELVKLIHTNGTTWSLVAKK